ncbi:protein tyrosine phosphatase domain-containing protein 1 isoform X3 [Takifugu flavidus]|uniref:protein tyrosine phosphatase domain-containing protein 1 isoform X3 n=1 Tax=Takifugu flavidus TaxID=433684 RepID=UPI0025440587|nr:protein tyrosine phosphatase domain-containing protein 1 isoform X3 [Takifugu flavidus]
MHLVACHWCRMMPTMTSHIPVPRPSYTQARENLVKAIPPKILCLLACGGKDCRYEGPECWKANQQVIRGLFSSWVTDDIVAMARPSNHLIEKYRIVEQFQRLNIRSVINMQLPGEHAHCGPSLDPESGFTYSPHIFMDNDIYFYNFGMPDYGVSSLVGIIDGVKVLAFAVTEGRVAVHCHAGLGRTGVLIACYLVYTLRLSPSEAVHYVRIKRPRSIQTRAQINQVFGFARLLGTQLVQYPDLSLRHGAPFTLQHYLNRQALLLHGREGRALRYTPKVVYLLCVRISCLALGLPSPPEVHAELEKRSALKALNRTDTGWSPYSSPTMGRHWCVQDLMRADLKPVNSVRAAHSPDNQTTKKHPHSINFQMLSMRTGSRLTKRSKWALKKPLHKHSSSIELCRTQRHPNSTSVARLVAKAMADQGPPGETVLQRSALLQEELNSSDCGWALLVTESDPQVLCCLLWTWLDRLKDPVLNPDDVERLNSKKPLSVLKKAQRHTIYCLLSCVNTVTSVCPHREEAVLLRLLRTLTRRPQEEVAKLAHLMKVLKAGLRESFHSYSNLSWACSTNATL